MQDQIRDSSISYQVIANDSMDIKQKVFIETRPSSNPGFHENLYSSEITRGSIPDWYFILILLILSGIVWARMFYGKFLNSVWISAYSYQAASKAYSEQSMVQKRFGLSLDLLYLLSFSLFLFLLNRFFTPGIFRSDDLLFVIQAFFVLFFLIFVRIIAMRLTAFIFERSELFLTFLYHFFVFNKILGMILVPFLIAIPYTNGILQEILIYAGISLVLSIYILRLFRVAIFVLKNVVLFFYLILYLCILEILPFLVVIKLLLFLAQV